ncbi:unnamed protein product [Adineta ricciae]|uniref:Uncharacterized protein n=1 Tax=Adineta ricciae TaxID=249248 RepID=A0A814KLE9_ADIRI|nr:unnamed protein product [Adineta ricciae]
MAEMDVLQSRIIQQIEAYLAEENLKFDYNLAKYERENQGWIPLERLSQFNKLSTYKYDTILNALRSKRSNVIEVDLCEPVCLRRRRRPLIESSMERNPYLHQTVVVSGLPRDAKQEDLMEFFNRFYRVHRIRMLMSTRTGKSFSGKAHVIFEKSQNARAFVQRSETGTIIYVNDYLLQLCNGYTLICKMLIDCDDRDEKDLNQLQVHSDQSFSHRLSAYSPRVSFNTNISVSKDQNIRTKAQSSISQTKSCLKSSTCATEQILFCQNTTNDKLSKALEYKNQRIVSNRYSYEFYVPDHLLQKTHTCIIIAALNPHCFTIQLKQDAIEFDKFQREINEFYNEVDAKEYLVTPEQIHVNLCVICADPKSSENDRIWNRSQILDFDPVDNTVNLFYVDLGTWDEYVPIHRLRHLIDSFHRHLVFSLTCRLAHISPINQENDDHLAWSTDATNQFLAVIDQVLPEIELLTLENDGCFQTNLFVTNSGQYVCTADTYKQNILNMTDDKSPVHPVIALYNRLGETLKRSLVKSRTSNLSGTWITNETCVKLIHIHAVINSLQQKIPLVFIHYEKCIHLPDFNICSLLKLIHSNIDTDTIERYALTIKYHPVRIERDHHSNIFIQINNRSLNNIVLYSTGFVQSILEHYHFPAKNVFLMLEKAKFIQLYASDLSLWFRMDNENLRKLGVTNIILRQFHTSIVRLSKDIFHVQDASDFQRQVLESKEPFIVNFHASWCGPCRILEPRLEKLIAEYNKDVKTSSGDQHITLAKVDVDKMNELSIQYNVTAVPTVVAIKNGKEINRFTGLIDEDRIQTIFDQLNR